MNRSQADGSGAFVACLLTVLLVGSLAVGACGDEAASGTSPVAASLSPVSASPHPVVWASVRPAVSYASADPPSTARTPSSLRVRKAGTIGWDFAPTVDIEVTALGCFDAGRDGLARSHRVGIFDGETRCLLASVTVRPRSRLDGFFRWESLKTPLVLKAGHYVVGTEDKGTLETVYTRRGWPEAEWGPQSGEHWAEEIPESTGFFVSRPSDPAFTAPTFMQDLWNDAPWFSPNFKFRPAVPSPSSAVSRSSAAPSEEPTSEPPSVSGPPQEVVVMDDGVYLWDAPGAASLGQTQATARRRAVELSTDKVPGAGLYAVHATWNFWPSGSPVRGSTEIRRACREAAFDDPDAGWEWSKQYHLLAAPGVAVCEGMFKGSRDAVEWVPYLAVFAVDGDKIAHEDVFLGAEGLPVTCYGSEPGPGDSAEVAARVGDAVGEAFATRDRTALQALLARSVLFRDTTTTPQGVRGRDAVLSSWATVAPAKAVKIKNSAPIAGPGWAVIRWTARRFFKDGIFPNGVDESRNGATAIEVRDGKVVRMTLYIEPLDGGGSILKPQ